MRTLILFITILFSGVLNGQFTAKPASDTIPALKGITVSPPAQIKVFTASLCLQETILFNYKLKGLTLFLAAENILNEIFKPNPVVDESGFHFGANPLMEIEETRGNTGYIKLGLAINLKFN